MHDTASGLLESEDAGIDGADADARHWRVLVRSVGSAGAGVVGALRRVLPWPEEQIAARLYAAPSELLRHVDFNTATAVANALEGAGLEVDVQRQDAHFEPGEPAYDVALVLQDFTRIIDVVREVALFLGVNVEQAKRIAYASPAELIGKVSASTVDALRRRFVPLGVQLDVSRVTDALYDVFVEPCTAEQRSLIERKLREADCVTSHESHPSHDPALVCAGLTKREAEKIFSLLKSVGTPLRIINRDFQRFDLRLEAAADNTETIAFLVTTAGMPEHVAQKVPSRTPIFVHHNVGYRDAVRLLAESAGLGATMSAHLLALQRFSLQFAKVADVRSTCQLLELFAGLQPAAAREAARAGATVEPRVGLSQARWLMQQLKRVGTDSRMILL